MKTRYTRGTIGKSRALDTKGKPIRGKKLKQLDAAISRDLRNSLRAK